MRCHICDKALSDDEIQTAPDGSYEPCSTCMNIILDAAYSDGFVKDVDLETELDDDDDCVVNVGSEIENLEEGTYRSYFDHCDISYADDGINDYD